MPQFDIQIKLTTEERKVIEQFSKTIQNGNPGIAGRTSQELITYIEDLMTQLYQQLIQLTQNPTSSVNANHINKKLQQMINKLTDTPSEAKLVETETSAQGNEQT